MDTQFGERGGSGSERHPILKGGPFETILGEVEATGRISEIEKQKLLSRHEAFGSKGKGYGEGDPKAWLRKLVEERNALRTLREMVKGTIIQ